MPSVFPWVLTLIAAAVGAFILSRRCNRYQAAPLLGTVIGAAAGAVGSLVFVQPLNYCMFEPERAAVDAIFGVLLVGLGSAAFISGADFAAKLWYTRHLRASAEQKSAGYFKGWLLPFLFLAPTLIILALFLYYPSLDTFQLSTLLARLGARRTAFVCVDNFTSLVSNTQYLNSVGITLVLSAAIVFFSLAISLFIALMAFQPIKGASIYRTLLVWPYAISPAVAGAIFLLLFNPTGGIINYFLNSTIGVSVPWLNSPQAAPWVVIIASVWKSLGYNVLFYIAGLQNVPDDLREAASIDGANTVQRFFRVVFPLLSPITFFLIITNTTYAFFDTFGTIDLLTGGGPLNSTTTMMYNIYEVGIVNNDLGKAAAQSIVLFVMVIGLTIFQFRTAGQRVTYGA